MGELIVNGIKWAFIIGLSLTFMVAISNLLSMITQLVFGNVIGEVFGILSCCLPFDASAVFGAIQTACAGILSFMIAQKIFNLTSARVQV